MKSSLMLLILLSSVPSYQFQDPKTNYRLEVLEGGRVVMQCQEEDGDIKWEMKKHQEWQIIYMPNQKVPHFVPHFEEINTKHIVIINATSLHQASYRCLDFKKLAITAEFVLKVKTVDLVCEERRKLVPPCVCPATSTYETTNATSLTSKTTPTHTHTHTPTTITSSVSSSIKIDAVLDPDISKDWICFDSNTRDYFTPHNKTYNLPSNNKTDKETMKAAFCDRDVDATKWSQKEWWIWYSVVANVLLLIILAVLACSCSVCLKRLKQQNAKMNLDVYDTIPYTQENYKYPYYIANQDVMKSIGESNTNYLSPRPCTPSPESTFQKNSLKSNEFELRSFQPPQQSTPTLPKYSQQQQLHPQQQQLPPQQQQQLPLQQQQSPPLHPLRQTQVPSPPLPSQKQQQPSLQQPPQQQSSLQQPSQQQKKQPLQQQKTQQNLPQQKLQQQPSLQQQTQQHLPHNIPQTGSNDPENDLEPLYETSKKIHSSDINHYTSLFKHPSNHPLPLPYLTNSSDYFEVLS